MSDLYKVIYSTLESTFKQFVPEESWNSVFPNKNYKWSHSVLINTDDHFDEIAFTSANCYEANHGKATSKKSLAYIQ